MTGLRALYVNPTFTKQINELSFDESRSVLEYLFRVQIENHGASAVSCIIHSAIRVTGSCSRSPSTHAENHVKYRWSKYDVAIWDNRVRSPFFRPRPSALNPLTSLLSLATGRQPPRDV